ncbi:ATP-binding cassette domain-containing protein [Novosphingobium acidiphilum]|uniref:ATP-binding cassette domain-containing protein n=1 Tax=Novosphingobium acidiphilum TaxID=505248 RepID=UPI0006863631|nr:ATP-binding cassette domain-containing protein [Novosphingobium acidiphilum]
MVKPAPQAIARIRPNPSAVIWWLTDSLGAIPIAAAIALAVDARTGARTGMLWASLLFMVGGCLRAMAVFRANIVGQSAAIAATTRLRALVHPALLPTRMLRGSLVGEDMHLAVDSIIATEGQVARFLPLRAASGLSPLLIALAVAAASWIASLIMVATLVPFVLALVLAGSAAARRAESQHVALNRLAGLFVDRLRNLPAILGFAAEDRVARHLGEAARQVARRTMDVLGIAFASSAILEFFAALSVALVAVYCGFSLLGLLPFPAPEHLTGLRAFFTLAMAPEFYLAMRRLAAAYHDKQQGEAAMAALNAEMAKIPVAVEPIAVPLQIAGKGVAFAHVGGETIGPLDWRWSSPGLHAIAGPTGTGKSTLLLGLIGQVPLVAGKIVVDGAVFAPAALNAAIGWAGQQVALLPGSLRTNLSMGQADDAAMADCLHSLGLGPMLVQRGGLGTTLDHRGSGLSGGERRRIGLARAMLSGRPILLLDEPTADLDEATAATIRSVLGRLATDHLVIVATHDAELVAMAETVLRIA